MKSSQIDKNNLHNLYQKINIDDLQLMNLQTFIITARNLSFRITAEYLCLTASAVSHRISKLEKQLGFSLFHRFARKIKLTNEGERLYDVLKASFDNINSEIQNIRNNERAVLTIFSHPSIAGDWLTPRLSDFSKRYPSIRLNIFTGNEQVDFEKQSIDMALYYSNGHFPGLNSKKIMEEEVFPVCSPDYAKQHNLINQPENLKNCTLLYDAKAWHYAAEDSEWQTWYKHMQLELPINHSVISFDSSESTAYAAVCNTGVAIGRLKLVYDRLKTGQLIEPFSLPHLKSKYSYYATWPRFKKISPRLMVFLDWLEQQGAQSELENIEVN